MAKTSRKAPAKRSVKNSVTKKSNSKKSKYLDTVNRFIKQPNQVVKMSSLVIWSVLFLFLYYFLNKQFTGPIVLSDEVGYLTKAAAIAGHITDSASSWHAGYSLFISPAFILFEDPTVIWHSIVFINSLLFLSAFLLAYSISIKLFPNKNFWLRLGLLSLLAIYPGWLVIAGYSFSTPAFVFVLLLLLKIIIWPVKNLFLRAILLGVLSGFLFWIHPIAIGIILSLVLVELVSLRSKKDLLGLLLLSLASALMVVFYSKVFDPWLNNLLTPEGYTQDLHYEEVKSSIDSFRNIEFWKRYLFTLFGQTSYVLIATLGTIVMSVPFVISKTVGDFKSKGRKINQETRMLLLALLAVVSTLMIGSMMFNVAVDQYRPDMWVYGRYSEMVLLPLFLISVFTTWRKKYFLLSIGMILLSGFLIDGYINSTNTGDGINYVNLMSFWPIAIDEAVDYIRWFFVAALLISLLSIAPRKTMLLALVPLSIISVRYQFDYHNSLLDDPRLAKKTALVDSVRSGLLTKKCIAFEPELPKQLVLKQRNRLYAYYLYDYELSRMSYEEWKASDCGGYLSYNTDQFQKDNSVQIIGKVELTGLYLIAKNEAIGVDKAYNKKTEGFYLNLNPEIGQKCILSGCFDRSAKELIDLTGNAGVYDSGTDSITAKSTAGNLIYGPFAGVNKGNYVLTLEGNLTELQGATVTISDKSNEVTYYKTKIGKSDSNTIEIPFYLKAYAFMLDISIDVKDDNFGQLKYYSLELDKSNRKE